MDKCCGHSPSPEDMREQVRAGYAAIARNGAGCCGGETPANNALAEAIGYGLDDLEALPEGANMGLSCGNPVALASLSPGEVVVDLGSGAGFDVFIAGARVGAAGRAIGVDMTPEMIAKARRNVAVYRERSGLDNVAFRLGEIEHLPLADNSVDVIISNCVINLSPDKPQVWRDMARVLKPGGRVAVSDLALLQPLPAVIAEMAEALVGCIAGAVLVEDTERMALAAGLIDVTLEKNPGFLDAMAGTNDPLYARILAALPPRAKPGDFITSLGIRARKPLRD